MTHLRETSSILTVSRVARVAVRGAADATIVALWIFACNEEKKMQSQACGR
jgi:hypothetical protein